MLYVSSNYEPLKVVIFVICFPLSYKLSTSVGTEEDIGVFLIRQGQHNNRSPPDVGFFLFCFGM